MKKLLYLLLIIFVSASCDLTDDEPYPHSREGVLIYDKHGHQKYWVAEGYYVDGVNIVPECSLDNLIYFKPNNYLVEPEGALKCSVSDTADYGHWYLNGDSLTLNTVTFPNTVFDLDTLTMNRLVGTFPYFGMTVTIKANAVTH